MSIDALEKEALALPQHERFALAERILRSTEPLSDPTVEAAWEGEIRSRIQALDEGHGQAHDASEVFRELNQRLG